MIGGASQVFITGVPVTVPDTDKVRMRSGEILKPAPFLPYWDPAEADTVQIGLLPVTPDRFEIQVDPLDDNQVVDKDVTPDPALQPLSTTSPLKTLPQVSPSYSLAHFTFIQLFTGP